MDSINTHAMRSSVRYISIIFICDWHKQYHHHSLFLESSGMESFLTYFTLFAQWTCFSFFCCLFFFFFFIYHATQIVVCGWEPVYKLCVTGQRWDRINSVLSFWTSSLCETVNSTGTDSWSTWWVALSHLPYYYPKEHTTNTDLGKKPNVNRCM